MSVKVKGYVRKVNGKKVRVKSYVRKNPPKYTVSKKRVPSRIKRMKSVKYRKGSEKRKTNLSRDYRIKSKRIRKKGEPTWKGDLRGSRI